MSLQSAPAEVRDAYLACDPRQQKYIDGVLAGKFHDVAMLEAGYAPSTARSKAGKVAKLANVAKVLSWHASVALAKQSLTVDRLVEEMTDIALFDPADIFTEGNKLMPVREWPVAARRAFSGWDANGMPKFSDKKGAVDSITRIKGWDAKEKQSNQQVVVGVVIVPQKAGEPNQVIEAVEVAMPITQQSATTRVFQVKA